MMLLLFLLIYKTYGKTAYYQRNRKEILNRAKECYENNKERLREQAENKYRELSNEEKYLKREYWRNRYHNMSEENKQRLKELLLSKKINIRLKDQPVLVKQISKNHMVIKVYLI